MPQDTPEILQSLFERDPTLATILQSGPVMGSPLSPREINPSLWDQLAELGAALGMGLPGRGGVGGVPVRYVGPPTLRPGRLTLARALQELGIRQLNTGESAPVGSLSRTTGKSSLGTGLRDSGELDLLTPEAVRDRFLSLAKQAHPDLGGNTEGMQRLNEVYALIQRRLFGGP